MGNSFVGRAVLSDEVQGFWVFRGSQTKTELMRYDRKVCPKNVKVAGARSFREG